MADTPEFLPPIEGTIRTRLVDEMRFKFVASGSAVPFVVLTNHGDAGGRLEIAGRPIRFRFLISPAATGKWQRSDAAEPHVDFADGPEAVSETIRQTIHDSCLDAWEAYANSRPELVQYARLTENHNNVVQLDEQIAKLEKQLLAAKGRRSNLIEMSKRIRATLPKPPDALAEEERSVLNAMVHENCWLSMREGDDAQLHPFQAATVLRSVDAKAAQRLVTGGFVQLHRYLADNRATFRIADRGRDAIKS